MLPLSKKALLKTDKELIELHKRCITTYLIQRALKSKYIKKFMTIYDSEITPKNIRAFFHRPIDLFVRAIILNRLDEISQYTNMYTKKKKKTKSGRIIHE